VPEQTDRASHCQSDSPYFGLRLVNGLFLELNRPEAQKTSQKVREPERNPKPAIGFCVKFSEPRGFSKSTDKLVLNVQALGQGCEQILAH
jgi:hypothetical protein